jgi:uncharacterized alkaline shock family protein YloU
VEGYAVISHDVLASYAADAALQVSGVRELVDGPRRHRGVRVKDADAAIQLEVHVVVQWGSRAQDVGSTVQRRVAEYVSRTAKLDSVGVDVLVEDVSSPTAT